MGNLTRNMESMDHLFLVVIILSVSFHLTFKMCRIKNNKE